MTVYVLEHTWDSESNEGSDILGVYDSLAKAQDKMEQTVQALKEEYEPQSSDEEPVWNDDYCWQDEYTTHLGFDSKSSFMCGTYYSWDIYVREVE
jgi:hypothetical protein